MQHNVSTIAYCLTFFNSDYSKLGAKVIEGKTKIVYDLVDHPGKVLIESKDRITAGNNARAHDLEGKAKISTSTANAVFELLNNAGKLLKLTDNRRNTT